MAKFKIIHFQNLIDLMHMAESKIIHFQNLIDPMPSHKLNPSLLELVLSLSGCENTLEALSQTDGVHL